MALFQIFYLLYRMTCLLQQFFLSSNRTSEEVPINLFCIFAAAIISYNLIEKPFLKIKSKFEVRKISARVVPKSLELKAIAS